MKSALLQAFGLVTQASTERVDKKQGANWVQSVNLLSPRAQLLHLQTRLGTFRNAVQSPGFVLGFNVSDTII